MIYAFVSMWLSCALFVLVINGRTMVREVAREVRDQGYEDVFTATIYVVTHSVALVSVLTMFAPVAAAAILARGRGAKMDE